MPIRTEPYVKVREVIKNAPTAIDADNNSDIGIVMVSDYGPELGRATGPSDFLSKYTIDGITVPRDAHISFINAYYMSYFSALVISRSTDTTATKGLMYYSNSYRDGDLELPIVCTTSEVWYKDDSLLDKSLSWTITFRKSEGNGAIAFILNDTVYYANITKDNLVLLYPSYANYSSFVALSDFSWKGSTLSNTIDSFREQILDFISSIRASLNSLDGINVAEIIPVEYKKNSDNEEVPITADDTEIEMVRIDVTLRIRYSNGSIELNYGNYNFNSYAEGGSPYYGSGTARAIDKVGSFYKVEVLTNSVEGFVGNEYYISSSAVPGDGVHYPLYNTPNELDPSGIEVVLTNANCGYVSSIVADTTDHYSIPSAFKASISWLPNDNLYFNLVVNGNIYLFYKGEVDLTNIDYDAKFELTNNSPENQIKSILESLGVHVSLSTYDSESDPNKITAYIITSSITNTLVSTDMTVSIDELDNSQSTYKERFSVRARTNAVSDYLKVKLDNSIGDNFDLIFEDDPYLVSLNPEAKDSSEVNIYIDYLNTVDLPIIIDVINQSWNPTGEPNGDTFSIGEPDEDNKVMFGEGLGSQTECSKTPYLLKAADKLGDQDQYDLAYLSCAGITKISFVKRMAYIAMNNYWFLPIDVPYDRTSLASIKNYFNALALDSSYLEAMGPFDRNQSLTGWINYIAASSLFYERLMSNKQNNDEFAPIYKETYGVMNYTNPVKMLTKPQREELLSLGRPVNYVNYNNRTRNYFLNDDWTHQSADNVMSEEQNRRLVNKINRDIRHNMDQFIGKQNNAITRSQVVDMINYYMTNEIMTKSFAPEAYEVICNKKNNPDEVIRAKQLKVTLRVRLYNSIKYIDVIDEVYPIGVEFEG